MSDDELIDAMLVAMYDDGCPGAVDSMRAVLAVVREHDATTVAALLAALTDAIDQVEHWAGYADTHYREKWGYEEGVARLRAALKGAE